jgi:hypothetical protein
MRLGRLAVLAALVTVVSGTAVLLQLVCLQLQWIGYWHAGGSVPWACRLMDGWLFEGCSITLALLSVVQRTAVWSCINASQHVALRYWGWVLSCVVACQQMSPQQHPTMLWVGVFSEVSARRSFRGRAYGVFLLL